MSTPAAPSAPETDGREAMGTAASEADDFLARAQALGLRLTRADYERTRAGVTAFLKAERLPAASPGLGDAPDDERRTRPDARADTPGAASAEDRATPRAADAGSSSGASAATPAPSAPPSSSSSTTSLSRWLRTTSGQLSFFTAVVQPMSGHGDEARTRITLDEVGSAEERRRRRARRRKLLEKQMLLDRQRTPREASPADSASVRGVSHSPARTIRAGSAPSEPATPTRPPPGEVLLRASTPLSHAAPPHDTPAAPPSTSSPPVSPEINVLNRMARVDSGGKLWLARRSSDAEPKSEDSAAAMHDDSGVFCEQETSDSSSMLGWGPRAFVRTASGATEHLNASMKSMSLLDRIMLSKTSPRRMRREAKARAHSALDTDDDEESAVDAAALRRAPGAELGADVSSTSHWADVSADSAASGAEDEVLRWAARLEAASDHPLAAPVVAAGRDRGLLDGPLATDVDVVLGRGLTGEVDGRVVAVGNVALLRERGVDPAATDRVETVAAELAEAGRTPVAVVVDGIPLGVLAIADTLRPEAAGMIRALHGIGVREVVMLTGDQPGVAQAVARQVGVDDVRAGLLPQDKLEAIEALQAEGRVVAMVGDGVNDAPALATADIGVAMGAAGSGVAIETADIALMGDRLERLPQALDLARRTVRVMRQNIAISLVTVAALLAGVFAGGVTMAVGMLVHEASVLLVIVNAMRLLRRPGQPRSTTSNSSRSAPVATGAGRPPCSAA